jgi:Uma2 family endonuclease
MAGSVIIEERIEIPMNLRSLADFRCWALSDQFPERGRIDFVTGKIEVDMSPEDFFCHGKLKGVIFGKLFQRVERLDLGHLVTDRTRISAPAADFSVEPDIVFISHKALEEGRVRLIPKSGQPDRYVELEGAPDLIVEIVSDSSVTKDTRRLPQAYARAGVGEFWLADARKKPLAFQIHHLVEQNYQIVEPDVEGFLESNVFGCCFRLEGQRDTRGHWKFDLLQRERRT